VLQARDTPTPTDSHTFQPDFTFAGHETHVCFRGPPGPGAGRIGPHSGVHTFSVLLQPQPGSALRPRIARAQMRAQGHSTKRKRLRSANLSLGSSMVTSAGSSKLINAFMLSLCALLAHLFRHGKPAKLVNGEESAPAQGAPNSWVVISKRARALFSKQLGKQKINKERTWSTLSSKFQRRQQKAWPPCLFTVYFSPFEDSQMPGAQVPPRQQPICSYSSRPSDSSDSSV
jgi:hypothetical protein